MNYRYLVRARCRKVEAYAIDNYITLLYTNNARISLRYAYTMSTCNAASKIWGQCIFHVTSGHTLIAQESSLRPEERNNKRCEGKRIVLNVPHEGRKEQQRETMSERKHVEECKRRLIRLRKWKDYKREERSYIILRTNLYKRKREGRMNREIKHGGTNK